MAYDTISVIVFFVVGALILLRVLIFAVHFIRKIRSLLQSISLRIRSLRKKKNKEITEKPANVVEFSSCKKNDGTKAPEPDPKEQAPSPGLDTKSADHNQDQGYIKTNY